MQMQETNPASYTLPAKLHRVRLYDNREINLFDQELEKLQGDYYIRSSMTLESHSEKVRVAIDGGEYADVETDMVLAMRNAVNIIEFEKTANDGGQSETDMGHFRLSFYVNDHLGNTRMVYHV
jgi:hypothetical protein